ncbi:acyl-CoA thioesterase, partial [Aquimarina celericrescens]|nr:acyl-CoA thioesterase [Aquimarina celericrescens]
TPIVESSTEHKLPLRYGDIATIKSIYVDSPAAKMIFRYEIYNQDQKLVCTGKTIQVFVGDVGNGDLSLTIPPFFIKWKQKEGLINIDE